MERTDLPFNQILEQEIQEWNKFRRALRKEDQHFLDQLFEKASLHKEAGGYSSRQRPFETIMISMLLEHEKALFELRSRMKVYEDQEGEGGDFRVKNPRSIVQNLR